jgi:hypothetical protein
MAGKSCAPIDSDKQIGLWPTSRLLAMDRRFVERVERAFENGTERRQSAAINAADSTRAR